MFLWASSQPTATHTPVELLAGLLINLTIPQPKEVVAYGLCSPAPAKQINYERRQMHTYCNKRPLGPRGSHQLHQSEVSATTETPRLTPRH